MREPGLYVLTGRSSVWLALNGAECVRRRWRPPEAWRGSPIAESDGLAEYAISPLLRARRFRPSRRRAWALPRGRLLHELQNNHAESNRRAICGGSMATWLRHARAQGEGHYGAWIGAFSPAARICSRAAATRFGGIDAALSGCGGPRERGFAASHGCCSGSLLPEVLGPNCARHARRES